MSMELQKISDIQPASFQKRLEKLSDGQAKILELLKNSIENNKQITTEDIVDLYFSIVSKDGVAITIRGNMYSSQHFYSYNIGKNHQYTRTKAITWFKQNLGACIIKGRLLAIPVIDIAD